MVAGLIRGLGATLRLQVMDPHGLTKDGGPAAPLLWLCWHNRILMAPVVYRRLFPVRRGGVLTSASRDGEVLALVARRFGLEAARGSSSRRSVPGFRESLALLRSGLDLCVTPDGPRGPRYVLKPGALRLAQKSGAALLFLHIRPHSCWRLRSWDGFIIPRPFARVEVELDLMPEVPAFATAEELEQVRSQVEARLRAGTGEPEAL